MSCGDDSGNNGGDGETCLAFIEPAPHGSEG